jgi:hypothetical protein
MPESNSNTNAAGSSSAISTDSERYQTKYGPAVMLTRKNYDQWKETFEILLNTADAWDIVNGTEVAPAGNTQGAVAARTDFRKRSSKAVSLITLSCSDEVRPYIKGIRDPQTIWDTLKTHFNTMRSQIWRTEVMMKFQNDRPIAGEPIDRYFTRLLNYRTQLEDTPNAILDEVFKTKIYTTLPDEFNTTIEIAQSSQDSLHDILDSFRRNESTRAIKAATMGTTAVDTNSATTSGTALHTQKGGRGHGKGRGRGGKRSNDDRSHNRTNCTNCKMNNHSTKDCRKRKRNDDDDKKSACYYCGLTGHFEKDCRHKKRAEDMKKKRKPEATKTTEANTATAGDRDLF